MQLMKQKFTIAHVTMLVLPIIALLLPLVQVKSYRWGLWAFADKLMRNRLPVDDASRIGAYVLLAALVLVPLAVVVKLWLKGRASRLLSLLPAIVAVVLAVALLLNPRINPGLGLWIYLVVAFVAAALPLTTSEKR